MSLKEIRKPAPAYVLNRSKSFGGPLNLQDYQLEVLGHGSKPGAFTFRRSPKVPRAPRPARAQLVFEFLKKGLRDFIKATDTDIRSLKSENEAAKDAQQLQSAEKFKSSLELKLSQVEALEDDYELHKQLREGVLNMAKAYVSTPGASQRESLSHVKNGFKECSYNMCAIEAQLENMMGTFHCKIKGMVGFARMCPGDVFEVIIKHGFQKWKSKGKIGRNQTQHWDNDTKTIKAVVGDILHIKANECKGFGKSVLLGQKSCEVKDLYSSHPHIMTVSVNSNGSLKFSIIITWHPLEGCDERLVYYMPSKKRHEAAHLHKANVGRFRDSMLSSVSTDSGHSDDVDHSKSYSDTGSSRHSNEVIAEDVTDSDKRNEPNSPIMLRQKANKPIVPSSPKQPRDRSQSPCQMKKASSSPSQAKKSTTHLLQVNSSLSMYRPGYNPLLRSSTIEHSTLEEALVSLQTVLEDYRGQYSELQKLEEQVAALDMLLRRTSGALSSRSSNVSISIESALGAFDFLEEEDAGIEDFAPIESNYSETDTPSDNQSSSNLVSPESTSKTSDSGIECLASQLREECRFSLVSTPEPVSTKNDEVDEALLIHLTYCERLLENLGNFGPLRSSEQYSLMKLAKQAEVLESLLNIVNYGTKVRSTMEVFQGWTEKQELQDFWARCVDRDLLCAPASKVLCQLKFTYGEVVQEKYDVHSDLIFYHIIGLMVDNLDLPAEKLLSKIVTVHQYLLLFTEDPQKDMATVVDELAEPVWVQDRLRSGDVDIVIKTILSFRKTLPAASVMKVLGLLLLTDKAEMCETASSYLRNTSSNTVQRTKAIIIFTEALEDPCHDIRQAACRALKILKAKESIDQLVYLAETDSVDAVVNESRETLQTLGEEGSKALQKVELTSHGFQGIQMKL
ncbi:rho family-interacting cell polarization regulator 2-like [Tubulanus polymorphus]|uniref:rho family-interacting cell polarization regulator 2-like n=1 Tax=Tubulanus polymorphus TaxID=672921 RepID=UPI003DA5CCFA